MRRKSAMLKVTNFPSLTAHRFPTSVGNDNDLVDYRVDYNDRVDYHRFAMRKKDEVRVISSLVTLQKAKRELEFYNILTNSTTLLTSF